MATVKPGPARTFERRDAEQLVQLMRALAEYEHYLEAFQVTANDLIRYGLGASPLFRAYVVPCLSSDALLGMAVTYVQPWTYTMRPTLILKELYVVESARGCGVGRELMRAVHFEATVREAFEIRWTVLSGNRSAERFYAALGGRPDNKWQNWHLPLQSDLQATPKPSPTASDNKLLNL